MGLELRRLAVVARHLFADNLSILLAQWRDVTRAIRHTLPGPLKRTRSRLIANMRREAGATAVQHVLRLPSDRARVSEGTTHGD